MIATLDLFCGAGGLTLGFKAAGFDSVAAVEIDRASVETYVRHSSSAEIFDTDVCNVSFKRYRGKVETIIGGPPCQPFSTGGLRAAENDERNMVPEFIRAVEEVRPYAFVMENVPGLTVGERGEYLLEAISVLSNLGYQVEWSVLNAEEFGVPQRRKRLFVVGMRDRRFVVPSPTHDGRHGRKAIITAGEVVSAEPKGEPNLSKVYYARRVDLRPSPFHGLLFNGGGRAIDLESPSPTIISSAGGNKTHFVDVLGVVPEYHAYLRKGGKPKEGEVPGCRRITVLESALLQTFPEDLRFAGRQSAQYRQIGNAVPPRLAEVVATALREQINGSISRARPAASVQGTLFEERALGGNIVVRKNLKRNVSVERAVRAALDRIDEILSGKEVKLPSAEYRRAVDEMIDANKGSVRAASLFLLFYWLEEAGWNLRDVPTGARGTYGDKLLSEELEHRGITLHGAITAFGENLGWKGNVSKFDLAQDGRFALLQKIAGASVEERQRLAGYLASRFAQSQVIANPLPPVGRDVLTFARAKLLLHRLIATPSEGHIQQFLIAALLFVHRQRYGYDIETHHPHASDKFDGTAGDIEERFEGKLHRAYEVTVRDDWQNRISDFKAKMDAFNLSKYVIISSNINNNFTWSEPASALTKLEPYGRDIAVVDISDFVNVFACELSAKELRDALNKAFEFISNQKLCGRADVKEAFRTVVEKWLDEIEG